MKKVAQILRLGTMTGLALLLTGCLDKPVEAAKIELSGDTVTFSAYTIKLGELEAPAQGPYTKFAGEYPEHWPAEWRMDERFYTPGGAIPEALKSSRGTGVAAFEFEGAFRGNADVFERWLSEQAQTTGIEIESNQLSTTFNVIERRKLELTQDAWTQAGLAGEVILNYGPRYAEYTHFTFTLVKYLSGVKEITEHGSPSALQAAEQEHMH